MKAQTRIFAIGLLSFAVVFAGCNRGTNPSATSNPMGVYTLASVDGKPVPCVVMHERAAVTVKSGWLKFGSNQTCASRSVFSVGSGREIQREVQAVYTQDGDELVLKWKGAGKTIGFLTSNSFTMTNEGMVFSYNK